MNPWGRIRHTGPPPPNTRGLRPDAPEFTPHVPSSGHYNVPPPQQMPQNPNRPPFSIPISFSRVVKKNPEDNYQRNYSGMTNLQSIQNEQVQPNEPQGVPSLNNQPQPDHRNSTSSWAVNSNPPQSEGQDFQTNYSQRENTQIESVQLHEPEKAPSIRNVPQPDHTNAAASRAVDNNVQPNEQQNKQAWKKGGKGNFNNKNSQKSTRIDESCNVYQEIDGRPNHRSQDHFENQSRDYKNRQHTSGRRSKDNYQKGSDQRRSSTNDFNKNTDEDAHNSATEANHGPDSWDDEVDKPTESTRKLKRKDDNLKREPQENRSGYGNHKNRQHTSGRRSKDNYQKGSDQRRSSTNNFNKNTDEDAHNSAAEANHGPDSWDDEVDKPTESTRKFKRKDDNLKREPQENRGGYGNRHNNRDKGYKPRDINYGPKRTSTNNVPNRDNSNNDSVEIQSTPDSWDNDDDIVRNNIPETNYPGTEPPPKPKEECEAKNIDSKQRHERSSKSVVEDKQATNSREEIDENDSTDWWDAKEPSPKKLIDPRMERQKRNKSDSHMFQDQSNIDRTSRRSEGNNRQRSSGISDKDKEIWDKEFNKWEDEWRKIKNFKIVDEIEGDLFEQPKESSLAHCVAEDLKMGSGIAVAFKREFKNVPDLLDQRAKQGGLAVLEDETNKRFVYYLVTKRESNGKPTYFTVWKSLCNMKKHIKQKEVKNLAIPRLACGLDRLEWDRVKSMIEFLFRDVDIKITVCNFQQPESTEEKKSTKCKLVTEETPITKIEPGTLILYLATTRGDEDPIMKGMSTKFNFVPKFRAYRPKVLGDIVYSEDKNYGFCGCFVRNTISEPISYKSLSKCLQNVNKRNKQFGKDAFSYVALQWVDAQQYYDDLVNEKVIMMLRNYLKNVEVYVCKGSFENQ